VIAKVEWHPGELYPRAGAIVTNLARLDRACRGVLQPARKPRSKESKTAEVKSSGRGRHAAGLPRRPSAFSSMLSHTTLSTSCGRWRCPRRRNLVAEQLNEINPKVSATAATSLRHFSRGRPATANVPGDPVAHRSIESAPQHQHGGGFSQMRQTTGQERFDEQVPDHEAAGDRVERSAGHPCGSKTCVGLGCPQRRTIARTTRESDEYDHIRGRTYGLGALSGRSV
jgi:hypothetical protein